MAMEKIVVELLQLQQELLFFLLWYLQAGWDNSTPTHSNPQYNGDEFQRSVYKPN